MLIGVKVYHGVKAMQIPARALNSTHSLDTNSAFSSTKMPNKRNTFGLRVWVLVKEFNLSYH